MSAPVEPEPELVMQGKFAMYATTRGSLVLVTDIDGRGVERRVFPARLIKLATKMFHGEH